MRTALVLGLLAAALLLTASQANAYVYYANFNGNQTIGRVNLDGSDYTDLVTGARHPCGVAVDSSHLFWANWGHASDIAGGALSSIGRSNLNGTGVNQDFIPGADFACGVAVDGAHVYWANRGITGVIGFSAGTTIGRANLDGSGVNQSFIGKQRQPCGVAVDGSHIYWGIVGTGSIGRANLNGSGVDPGFITGASGPCGVTVDATHIYWDNSQYSDSSPFYTGTTIGRANLDGSAVNQNFITTGTGPNGVAIGDDHIWWANFFTPYSIGRANLAGGGVVQHFAGAANGAGVAVDLLSPPMFKFGPIKTLKRHGLAILTLKFPGPGILTISGAGVIAGPKLRRSAGKVPLAVQTGTHRFVIKATGRAKRKLKRTGSVKLKVKLVYVPDGGSAAVHRRTIRLVKK
jgi:hypothetical protein